MSNIEVKVKFFFIVSLSLFFLGPPIWAQCGVEQNPDAQDINIDLQNCSCDAACQSNWYGNLPSSWKGSKCVGIKDKDKKDTTLSCFETSSVARQVFCS